MAQVEKLVAICRLDQQTRQRFRRGPSLSFGITTYADLDDGRRVMVDTGRGFSSGPAFSALVAVDPGRKFGRLAARIAAAQAVPTLDQIWHFTTAESIAESARMTFLPDEPVHPGDHFSPQRYWESMLAALASAGVEETADHMAQVPLTVELDADLQAKLDSIGPPPGSGQAEPPVA